MGLLHQRVVQPFRRGLQLRAQRRQCAGHHSAGVIRRLRTRRGRNRQQNGSDRDP